MTAAERLAAYVAVFRKHETAVRKQCERMDSAMLLLAKWRAATKEPNLSINEAVSCEAKSRANQELGIS